MSSTRTTVKNLNWSRTQPTVKAGFNENGYSNKHFYDFANTFINNKFISKVDQNSKNEFAIGMSCIFTFQ